MKLILQRFLLVILNFIKIEPLLKGCVSSNYGVLYFYYTFLLYIFSYLLFVDTVSVKKVIEKCNEQRLFNASASAFIP